MKKNERQSIRQAARLERAFIHFLSVAPGTNRSHGLAVCATRTIARASTAALILALFAGPVFAQSPAEIVAQASAGTPANASPQQLVDVLKRVASALNTAKVPEGPFGILRKASGHNCVGYSCDIVCAGQGNRQVQFDVFIDGNPTRPAWGRVRPPLRTDVCEIQPAGNVPNPGPGPQPPPDDVLERLSQLDAYVAKLNEWARLMQQENEQLRQTNAEQNALMHNLQERLALTEAALPVGCEVTLFGIVRLASCNLRAAGQSTVWPIGDASDGR